MNKLAKLKAAAKTPKNIDEAMNMYKEDNEDEVLIQAQEERTASQETLESKEDKKVDSVENALNEALNASENEIKKDIVKEVTVVRDAPKPKAKAESVKRNSAPTEPFIIVTRQRSYKIQDINFRYFTYKTKMNKTIKGDYFNYIFHEEMKKEKASPTVIRFEDICAHRRKNVSDYATLVIRVEEAVDDFIVEQSSKRVTSAAAYVDDVLTKLRENDKTI